MDTGFNNYVVGGLLGPFQIYLIAQTLEDFAPMPFAQALLISIAGSAAIMISLGVLSYRYFSRGETWRKFQLSTILLVMVPVSLYLAALRVVFSKVGTDPTDWIAVAIVAGGIVVLTLRVYAAMSDVVIRLSNFGLLLFRYFRS